MSKLHLWLILSNVKLLQDAIALSKVPQDHFIIKREGEKQKKSSISIKTLLNQKKKVHSNGPVLSKIQSLNAEVLT